MTELASTELLGRQKSCIFALKSNQNTGFTFWELKRSVIIASAAQPWRDERLERVQIKEGGFAGPAWSCGGGSPHLALARDGLVEQQAAAVLLLQAGVVGPRRRAGSSTAPAAAPEGLEAVGGQRRRRRGRVGLIAGGGPAPVAPR